MSDKCTEHTNLMMMVTEIKADIKYMRTALDDKVKKFDYHLKDSTKRVTDIHDNTRFRCSASKAIWIIYGALVGLIGKILFFK